MIQSNTIKQFTLRRLDDFEREYNEKVNRFSRWKDRKHPFQVFLSPDLFQRLFEEEGISAKPDKVWVVSIDDFIIYNKKHPKIGMDFVIDINNKYPIGYNPQFYGLKELSVASTGHRF
jgi:hypothetical protein